MHPKIKTKSIYPLKIQKPQKTSFHKKREKKLHGQLHRVSRYAIKWRFFSYISSISKRKEEDEADEEEKITFDFVLFEKRDLTLSVDEIG